MNDNMLKKTDVLVISEDFTVDLILIIVLEIGTTFNQLVHVKSYTKNKQTLQSHC